MSKPDLENIVRSPSAETFLCMVTKGFYDNSYTGLWMYEVIGREWDEMREWAERLKNEIHPQTCTWSIGIWEWVYGLGSNETMSLESRRHRILAKIIGTRPINPEAIRNGVAKITGCDVDVKDFTEPYRFSLTIHMQEEKDDPPYKAVHEYVRTVKPAHLVAFLTWAFHVTIDCTCLEQAKMCRMFIRISIPFQVAWLLNGEYWLDGRKMLDSAVRFGMFTKPDDAKIICKGISMWHPERFGNAGVILKKNEWYLDGEYLLNGEKLLNAEITQEML
jgi:hypothetical protein